MKSPAQNQIRAEHDCNGKCGFILLQWENDFNLLKSGGAGGQGSVGIWELAEVTAIFNRFLFLSSSGLSVTQTEVERLSVFHEYLRRPPDVEGLGKTAN